VCIVCQAKPPSRQVAAAVESATFSSRAGRSCEQRGDTTVGGGDSYTCSRTRAVARARVCAGGATKQTSRVVGIDEFARRVAR